MKTLPAIIGALALASFGCGDDTPAPAFTFEGNAAYCISHADEMSTCVSMYLDLQIEAQNDISSVWANIYRNGEDAVKISEKIGEGSSMAYSVANEICIRGDVSGVSLLAEDARLNQAEYPAEEVDCETLDAMMSQ